MGNQPSTENHNKLSKPKTNTNSASAAGKLDSPQPTTSRSADLTPEGRQQIKDALLSPIASEFDPTTWTHEDDGLGEVTKTRGRASTIGSRSNSRTNSRANSRTNSLSCFRSKHSSAAQLAGLADSKLSLASVSHVDIAEAIRLLQQVKKNGTPEELAALQEVLESPEEPPQPVAEAPPSRRTSLVDRSSSSLTRRQSLVQTPGVGTRHSPIEGRRRTWNSWKAPKLSPEEEAKWQQKSKAKAHLSPQAALRLSDEPCDSNTTRAHTPSDLDYAHLGNLQPGTLVVTNGAASPVPSSETLELRKTEEEDYFEATEYASSPLTMKSSRQRAHTRSKSAAVPATSSLYELEANEVATPYELETPVVMMAYTSEPQHNTEAESPKFLRLTPQGKKGAAQFAQSYQDDIPLSPFLVSEETTESNQREPSPTLPEPKPQPDIEISAPSSPSIAPTSNKPKSRASQRPAPRTTDSGYSSAGSLRIVGQEPTENATTILCHRCNDSPQMVEVSQGRETRRSILVKQNRQFVESPNTTSDSDGSAESGRSKQSLSVNVQKARYLPALNSPVPSTSSSTRSSTSECVHSPITSRSIGSRASFDSASSKQQKRFHKKRPSQAEHPVVQSCQPIPEGTIPEVPTRVRAKFERRVSSSPGIDCLTHTYPTKEHVSADDSTMEASAPEQTEFKPLAELEAERAPTPPAHGRRRSLSFFRRKSAPAQSQTEQEPEQAALDVVHLGTITSSLGTSPYDIAMSDTPRQRVVSPTHPHQLGASLPRSKSMVTMDSKSAAEFARLHSRDLSVNRRDMPAQQRRKSLHNLKKATGEATASKLRPQSIDVPPVPSINTARLTVPQTGKPQGPRAAPSPRPRSPRGSPPVIRYGAPPQQPPQGVISPRQSQVWHQRRRTLGDRLYSDVNLDLYSDPNDASNNASPVESPCESPLEMTPRKEVKGSNNISRWDRFSGGLDYNYEHGAGIGGSAGTRSHHSNASLKSLAFQHQYGVDLSDVPIMIRYQS
ncbi:uncharacterized protein J4E87_005399 [Alternaria ethzedia]|uniref:uncharacterized protein n=1 Tax=Alternaria ethzedia TaxID=181014 RepID=UPI0020C4BEC7|nr:uncharacterized protein J4E87_005399 [Alternaria ethzedia]KAI4624918.1 hypothetical protein J4E87_005399 [Alternaria ethzedia]KAI4699430.1 hypothetical protein J4E81_004454 [Alternaria sp. BMP 2799]